MKPKSSTKSILIVIIIAVAAGLVYLYFQGGKPSDTGLIQEDFQADADLARMASLFNQIKSLKIDSKFFSDLTYQTLLDHTQPIPPVGVGRVNPFAPIPGAAIQKATR